MYGLHRRDAIHRVSRRGTFQILQMGDISDVRWRVDSGFRSRIDYTVETRFIACHAAAHFKCYKWGTSPMSDVVLVRILDYTVETQFIASLQIDEKRVT
jgi:hypothetical protein